MGNATSVCKCLKVSGRTLTWFPLKTCSGRRDPRGVGNVSSEGRSDWGQVRGHLRRTSSCSRGSSWPSLSPRSFAVRGFQGRSVRAPSSAPALGDGWWHFFRISLSSRGRGAWLTGVAILGMKCRWASRTWRGTRSGNNPEKALRRPC